MKYQNIRLLSLFLFSFLLIIVWNMFVLKIGRVHGVSMAPSYKDGQLIVFNCLAYGFQVPIIGKYLVFWRMPASGESIILRHPQDGRLLIKRILAVQGESLPITGNNLVLDGRKIELSFAQKEWLSQYKTVPQGQCFVIGDNVEVSKDSRDWGFIPLTAINGKLLF